MHARIAAVAALLLALAAGSCSRDQTIVVGAKGFTEGYLLGHMAVFALEDAGYEVEEQFGLPTSTMRSALETGQVDLYYEYTGTTYTGRAQGKDHDVMVDSARVLAAVRTFDSTQHGLVWLEPMPFNDTYSLVMKAARAEELHLRSISDLAAATRAGTVLKIGIDAEFYGRADGWKPLAALYGLDDGNVVKLDEGLIYQAVDNGSIDVGMGYSTAGQIAALHLVTLDDDRHFFPAYNPAAVVRRELLAQRPGIRAVLERLNRAITPAIMRQLNAEVAINHRDPRKVAQRWMIEQGLIRRNAK